MCGRAGEVIHGDDGNDEQDEDDKGDEDVDELVDARGGVKGDVFVRGFGAKLGSAEVSLLVYRQQRLPSVVWMLHKPAGAVFPV